MTKTKLTAKNDLGHLHLDMGTVFNRSSFALIFEITNFDKRVFLLTYLGYNTIYK